MVCVGVLRPEKLNQMHTGGQYMDYNGSVNSNPSQLGFICVAPGGGCLKHLVSPSGENAALQVLNSCP